MNREKIAILTDSSSSIYTIEHNFDNLFMIDVPCFIQDKVFTDFAKNKNDVFYEALRNTNEVAKTSQPSVGATVMKIEEIKELGYKELIYLPISNALSGTYDNGFLAQEMVNGIKVHLVDTKTTVSVLGAMALEAAKMAKEGYGVGEIIKRVLKLRQGSNYYFTVNDLTSLVKNGRLSNAKSFIANILRIKPIIQLTPQGKITGMENVRTFKSAIKRMIDLIEDEVDQKTGHIHISYATDNEFLTMLKEQAQERFPNLEVKVFMIPATIVAHTGLSALGIGYVNY